MFTYRVRDRISDLDSQVWNDIKRARCRDAKFFYNYILVFFLEPIGGSCSEMD